MSEITDQADMPAEAAAAALEAELKAPPPPPPADSATAPDTSPEDDQDEAPPDGEDHDEDGDKPRGGFQRRIAELTKYRREAERDRDYWRELATKNQQPPADPTPPPPPTPAAVTPPTQDDPRPTPEQFDFDEAKFNQALDAWVDRQAERRAEARVAERQQKEQAEKAVADFRAREAEFAKTASDYRDVVYSDAAMITKEMAELGMSDPDGPALLYHLAKHQDEARRIAALPPLVAAVELVQMRQTLKSKSAAPPPAPPVTRAPPPPPRLDDDGSDSLPVRTTDPESDTLSDEEWARAERKRMSRRR